jgi:hypothetical protein
MNSMIRTQTAYKQIVRPGRRILKTRTLHL